MKNGIITMTNHSPEDVEILVHITAPSKVADDALYRQLAQAYLDFTPQTRTQLVLQDTPQPEGEKGTQEEIIVATGFASSTPQHAFDINSQDISFQSALDNRTSPRLLHAATKQVVIPSSQESAVTSQTSWLAPPSQISDSYPMPETGLLNISPSRVLRQYIGRSTIPDSFGSTPSSPSPTRKRGHPPSSSSDQVDVPSSQSAPGMRITEPRAQSRIGKQPVIPFTPQPTSAVSRSPGKPKGHCQPQKTTSLDILPDVTHISSSLGSVTSESRSPRAESEPPPAKRLRATRIQHADLLRSVSDTGPVSTSSSAVLEEIHNSLEIRPPSPPVGLDIMNPEDMISDKFAKLAKDLTGRYRPELKRQVESFERGYWLLDCKTWDMESRMRMWVFLNNYLHRQLAGWGTWCRRDANYEWIRLYCWGHVVEHTYLLLYLSSERYLKRTSAAWYDAGGELVIQVPPHEKY